MKLHRAQYPFYSDHVTVTGILKGFDQLLNVVLDEVEELPHGANNSLDLHIT